jgi:hypothetical protein
MIPNALATVAETLVADSKNDKILRSDGAHGRTPKQTHRKIDMVAL